MIFEFLFIFFSVLNYSDDLFDDFLDELLLSLE